MINKTDQNKIIYLKIVFLSYKFVVFDSIW